MDSPKTFLNDLRERHLYRSFREAVGLPGRRLLLDGREAIDFAGNDYLGLRFSPILIRAAQEALLQYGASASASRFLAGNHPLYTRLESAIADFKHCPAALVFGSGYLLNLTLLPALAGPGDALFLDRLCHASLVDGARLSGAKLIVTPHADSDGLEKALRKSGKFRRKVVVTESIFSMDGDQPPLSAVIDIARAHDALCLVDEAHATGVTGLEGRGACDTALLSRGGGGLLIMGTFSKALGSYGAFVCCSAEWRDYFINTTRGLMFTTALPPSVLAASLAGVAEALNAGAARESLKQNTQRMRQGLSNLGLDTGPGDTQIVPLMTGAEDRALALSQLLLNRGFYAPAVRFPTVKKGRARLRISLSAEHTADQIVSFVNAVKEAL